MVAGNGVFFEKKELFRTPESPNITGWNGLVGWCHTMTPGIFSWKFSASNCQLFLPGKTRSMISYKFGPPRIVINLGYEQMAPKKMAENELG